MKEFLLVAVGIVVGYLLGRGQGEGFRGQNKSNDLNEQRAEEKQKHLERILQMFEQHAEVTNDMVEKALEVSNTSAERYLDELEKQGKLRQIGRTGRSVTYKRS